jgi:hypothetical protein
LSLLAWLSIFGASLERKNVHRDGAAAAGE